jgi:hypothetical protein
MEIAYAFLAKAAVFAADGTLSVIGGDLSELQGDYPLSQQVILVAKLLFAPAECGHRYKFEAEILAPGGDILQSVAMIDMTPPVPKDLVNLASVSVLADFGTVVFPKPGDHMVQAKLDGEAIKGFGLRLRGPEETPAGHALVCQ